ncbi:DUF6574 domain-containing protein [Oceanobacillus chungangensis]|uniref:Zinc ribbon domain-containing protein n=1 Tax=Oceanobacillus chungangensis TaxID=1229152 RepID=A0A3D8PGY6_9BACI|nr:DUF6574 domain-containing protein [Oceanobacillus chungangensis]RDW15346.1 hypothetical protein CWR45_16265 [Oceanobacillus chungangensis]
MLVCPKCNNHQESGKFCGVCGEALQQVRSEEQSSESIEHSALSQGAAVLESQSQPTASAIKSGVSQYWSYFLSLVKNPTRAFQSNEKHYLNGLITLALYAIIFSLSIYFLTNSVMRSFGGFFGESVPFFALVSRIVVSVIITFVITFGSAFAMIKLAKNQDSFKIIIAQYGSIIVPFTALNVIAMLGGLIGSYQLTFIPLLISLVFTFTFIPVLFVFEKVSKINANGQKVYLSLATIVLISFISYILSDALLSSLLEDIEELLYYVW